MLSAQEALERLREGNRRFVSGEGSGAGSRVHSPQGEGAELEPLAIVLGCSDARVPAEIVFDHP